MSDGVLTPTEVTLSAFTPVRPSQVAVSALMPLVVGSTINLGNTNLASRALEAIANCQQVSITGKDAFGTSITVRFMIDKVYPGNGMLVLKVKLLRSSAIKLGNPQNSQAIISVNLADQATTLLCEEIGITTIELVSPAPCGAQKDEPYTETIYVPFRGRTHYWAAPGGELVAGQTIAVRLTNDGKLYLA